MKNLSKLLIAAALATAFAAPAFAGEEATLQERNVYSAGAAPSSAGAASYAYVPARSARVAPAAPGAQQVDVHSLTQRAQAGIGRF